MLGGELASRARKLQQEQQARLAKEQAKKQREAAVAAVVAKRQQEREAEASRRRAAAIAAEELERAQHEEELEQNHGVWWRAQLAAAPLPATAAAEKGIKRGADKVLLPPSASAQLMAQDAPKNGAMFFELATPGGRRTHAGLLDFTAPEGSVSIPPAVAASLWPDAEDAGDLEAWRGQALTVTYRRLKKGTFARLQPAAADFQQAVGEAVEAALTQALSQRSAVSEGDWLAVPFGGKTHALRIQQLRPARQVSVIDTEMEAEVEPSIETEQRLAREAAESERRRQELQAAEAAADAARQAAAEAAVAEARRRERLRQEAAASLPPEPPQGEGVTLCMLRFPDGSRHTRRLRHQDPLALLFAFADSKGAGGCAPGSYALVTQFPRRVLSHSFPGSVAEAGLDPRQEALLLEPLAAEAAPAAG